MIINKEYILSRIHFLVKSKENSQKITKGNEMFLFKIKLLFPVWLRNILFSPYNPVFATYKGIQNRSASSKGFALHPVPVDFMYYCFENNINFNTHDFFPPEDDMLIEKHIDERIKCILSGWSDEPRAENEYFKIEQALRKKAKKKKQSYSLPYEGISYRLPQNNFSYPVFCAHYGLKQLPASILEYIKGKDFLDIGALDGDASVMFCNYEPAQIYAYEPVSSNYQLLLKTIELQENDKICAVKKGIGDKEATMEISIDNTNAGANTLLKNLSVSNEFATETIQITTIDKECRDKKAGLIKMDIEGFEYSAIRAYLF